jgi:hypothetical protein
VAAVGLACQHALVQLGAAPALAGQGPSGQLPAIEPHGEPPGELPGIVVPAGAVSELEQAGELPGDG